MVFDLQFANQPGLWALASIIPLIIIYLLRPRPLKIKIPSLMFLLQLEEKRRRLNILRKIIRDPLFLIQLLVLIIISLTIASPYIMAREQVGGGHTVIVLDASASMQVDKFKKAVDLASQYLSSKNTIILAESVPILLIKESPPSSARDSLAKISPKATMADLSSAINLGRRLLTEGGRIIVISDFISWEGDDPAIAMKLAQANGIEVDFLAVSGRTDNLGIINGWFEPNGDYKIDIKNYNDREELVSVEVVSNNEKLLTKTLALKPRSEEYLAISNLAPGTTKITLQKEDALSVDNTAYVYLPKAVEKKFLYLSFNRNSPSLVALRLLPYIKIDSANNIPADLNQYSVLIISNLSLSQEASAKILDYLQNGGNLVILASKSLENREFLPLETEEIGNDTTLNIVLPSKITEGTELEKVEVKKHLKSKPKKGSTILVEAGDNSPMLSFWKVGKGTVLYSGLADPEGDNIYDPLNPGVWNNFHAKPTYPLFWLRLIEWLTGSLDVSEFNAKTESFIKFNTPQKIQTPSLSITTDNLLLDEVGIYRLPDKTLAVNMYNDRESNLEKKIDITQGEPKEIPYVPAERMVPKELDIYFILLGMLFVFFELYYLKWRGELWR